jgi:four helix bundle protein
VPETRDPSRTGQEIRDRTFEFACGIVEFCKALYDAGGVGRIMAPQLLGSGTSVAAMLEEGKAAESRRDFVSKISIALKEAREAHLRLRVHERCQVGPQDQAVALRGEANQLVSILTAILRNTRSS